MCGTSKPSLNKNVQFRASQALSKMCKPFNWQPINPLYSRQDRFGLNFREIYNKGGRNLSFNITGEAFDKAFPEINKKKKKNESRWKNKKSKYILKDQVHKKLTEMLEAGKGESRNDDKGSIEEDTKNKIYSEMTFKGYKSQFLKFANFLKEKYPEILKLQQIKKDHVNEYLQYMIDNDLSAYTISTSKAAIAKVLGVSSTSFMATPPRTRKNIKRSRYEAVRDKHISEETEAYFAKITSATGLRRSEMERVRGVDLQHVGGKYYVKVRQGKGGKSRQALICGENEAETMEIVNLFKQAGEMRVVPKLPSHYDNHYYRGVYAKRIYNMYARPVDEIPAGSYENGGRRYIMKGDRAGEILDKDAMLITSKYLGHNRIDVIAQSYLY